MRSIFIFLTLLISLPAFAQKKAYISFEQFTSADSLYKNWSWNVNGTVLSRSKNPVKIKINYPKIDTIYFKASDTSKPEMMLTRFNKGKTYKIIAKSGEREFYIEEQHSHDDDEKKQSPAPDTPGAPIVMPDPIDQHQQKITYGSVQFQMKNISSDSALIVGSFGDIGTGLTSGLLIYMDTTSNKLPPYITNYSDNTNYVVIGWANLIGPADLKPDWFMKNPYLIALREEGSTVLAVYDKELVRFRVCFFNDENLLVIYDVKTGAIDYKIQDTEKK